MTETFRTLPCAHSAKPPATSRYVASGRSAVTFSVAEQFDFRSSDYEALFASADATAFQHPLWLDRSLAHLAHRAGSSVTAVLAHTPAGRLVFALPLVRRRLGPFSWHDAADLKVGDYNAMVVDPQFAADPSAVVHIQSALKRFGVVRIGKVRDGGIGMAFGHHAQTSAMGFQAHEMALGGLPAEWQSQVLDSSFARFLAKKRKRLAGKAKGAVAIESLTDAPSIRRAFETMRAFRQDRWSGDLLADDKYLEFYVDVATAGSGGLTRTYELTANGRTVAVLFGVSHRQRFCFLLLGFDGDEFRNCSPGLLMLESVIGDCIARGDAVFDLTIGDESYKKDFATRSVPMRAYWFGRAPWRPMAKIAFTAAVGARSAAAQLRGAATAAWRKTWHKIGGSTLWIYTEDTLLTCCHLGGIA